LAALLCAASAAAQSGASVHIQEIGLQGFYLQDPYPTRVRLSIQQSPANPARTLRIQVYPEKLATELGHTFEFALVAGGPEQVNVPVLISRGDEIVLSAELLDGSGKVLSRDSRHVEPFLGGSLIGVVCDAGPQFQAIRSAILSAGNMETRVEKEKRLRFVELREIPETLEAYSAVSTLIVAGSLRKETPTARVTLENFLRAGNRMILLEPAVPEKDWLAPYRRGPVDSQWHAVGLGALYRADAMERIAQLDYLYQGWRRWMDYSASPEELPWARRRLSTRLVFPSFMWLLYWLAAFLVIAGPVNFILLRKMGRQEWGWVTTPALSLLFATAIYFASTINQPTGLGADTVTLYWMDDRSPRAWGETGVRITAPRSVETSLRISNVGTLEGLGRTFSYPSVSSLMTDALAGVARGMTVRRSEDGATEVPLKMLPWSFRDFVFTGPQTLPGTVELSSPGVLRNATGLRFREAILVDAKSVYTFGEVAAGAELRLQDAKVDSLASQAGHRLLSGLWDFPTRLAGARRYDDSPEKNSTKDYSAEMEYLHTFQKRPFSVLEMIRAWPQDGGHAFDVRSALFIGLAENEGPAAQLAQPDLAPKRSVLVIVSLSQKP